MGRPPVPPPASMGLGIFPDDYSDDEEEAPFEYDFTSGKGALSEVANIYRSKKDLDGTWTYSSEPPEDAEEPAENEETEKRCLVIRNKKSQGKSRHINRDDFG